MDRWTGYGFQGVQSCKQGLQFQYFASIELCSSAAVVPQVNLPRCEARRRRFIMTWDIFGTGQTNILGLCYLFGKTLYKQPTVTEINTLDQIAAVIETDRDTI